MKVKEFKEYLKLYKDDDEVQFKTAGINYFVDEKLMAMHNIKEMSERKECKVYLK